VPGGVWARAGDNAHIVAKATKPAARRRFDMADFPSI
jgi:hypothetical protein